MTEKITFKFYDHGTKGDIVARIYAHGDLEKRNLTDLLCLNTKQFADLRDEIKTIVCKIEEVDVIEENGSTSKANMYVWIPKDLEYRYFKGLVVDVNDKDGNEFALERYNKRF